MRGYLRAWLVAGLLLLGGPWSFADGERTWHREPGCRWAALEVAKTNKVGFTLLAAEQTGVSFTNLLPLERHLTNQMLLNGSGVAAGDVDGDGRVDIFFGGLGGRSRLYRNRGNWQFKDITDEAGVGLPGLDVTGVLLADVNGDGTLDLILNSHAGGVHVFFNDGKAHFKESEKNPGLNAGRGGVGLALGDFDGDGALDLYIGNYRAETFQDWPRWQWIMKMVSGKPMVVGVNGRFLTEPDLTNRLTFKYPPPGRGGLQTEESGEPDLFCRNDGQGGFAPASWSGGTFLDEDGQALASAPLEWTYSVMFRDLNGDGLPDLYTCGDFRSPDRIWINDGRGHFRALARLAMRRTPLSSMGLDVADINRDGHDDIFSLEMLSRDHRLRFMQRLNLPPETPPFGVIDSRTQVGHNTLSLSRGDGTFAEMAQFSGVEASDWSWTPMFLDVDLDGYEDLLVANGFERDVMNMDVQGQINSLRPSVDPVEAIRLRRMYPRLDTPNVAFRNLGNLRFAEVGEAWGFAQRGVSQGMATADLDNDGDLDIVINNLNGPAFLLRNEASAPRLAVRLKGQAPNTHGIGGKIKVTGGLVPQSQEIMAGGRYASSDDAMRAFACGAATNLTIEVAWRSGRRSVVTNAMPNRVYEIDETGANAAATERAAGILPADQGSTPADKMLAAPSSLVKSTPFFQDVSVLLNHIHSEEPSDDFDRQPLLLRGLSQLGPGVSWFDLDGDGWEDLIIASGKGGKLAVFRNDTRGGFTRMNDVTFAETVYRDQTTVLGWRKPDGTAVLLIGSSNYEDGQPGGSAVRSGDLGKKLTEDLLPGQASSTGPLAMADVDGDGQLDLFVGGRVVPGRYPEPASSLMFRGNGGEFQPDVENTKRFANLGLVNGAVFSDVDGDGDPDLILACEWGPIRIFRNDRGVFTEITAELGLDKFVGWWNGVAVGDFDGDGRLDIVGSNWGRNTHFERWRAQPLRLFYGDVDENGTVDTVLAYFDEAMKKLVPAQQYSRVGAAIPRIRERTPTWTAYASASLKEIYGDMLKRAKELQATCFETTVFLNRGNKFTARELPIEAQLSPAFAVCVSDMNGDGREDIFLSQNFFNVPNDTSRYDAGRGLWLRGDGAGNFQSGPGQESGVLVYAEQRGAAVCDFDGDGRVDLVVSQNAGPTRLFKNSSGKPGLRVRLMGPPGNPQAIGAVLRLSDGTGKLGPAREIHAGSGYWSQDSAVAVLCANFQAKQIHIRWPGGKTTVSDLPPGSLEVVVDQAGAVEVIRP